MKTRTTADRDREESIPSLRVKRDFTGSHAAACLAGLGAALCMAASASADVLVNLDATGYAEGPLNVWTNTGLLSGDFTALVSTNLPQVTNVAGVKGVGFHLVGGAANGTSYIGPAAPSSITGTNSRSVEAWVYNSSQQPEETVVGWGRRGGGPNGSNVSFNHGTDPTFGAVGHWGGPDIGWNNQITFNAWTYITYTWDNPTRVTRVYRDGIQVNVESNITLSTHPVSTLNAPLPIRIARQNEANGTPSGIGVGEIIIAKVRIHDLALSAAQVQASFFRERCQFFTDELCADSDGDGIPNFFELQYPTCLATNNPADAALDCDGDGLTNLQEYQIATFPNVADTDGDGISDSTEVNRLDGGLPAPTDPIAPDTDNDGISDLAETDTGTFVSPTDTGTDPRLRDTDGDGLGDRYEVGYIACMNPNTADSNNDCDSDGLSNLQEFQRLTLPNNPDSDGDTLTDGAEVNRTDGGNPAPLDPLRPDTDTDGIRDDRETDTGVFVSLTDTGTDPRLWDTDGDKFSDLHEFVRSTSPFDALSAPDLTNTTITPLINLDATVLAPGPLPVWTNTGVFGGVFNAAGIGPAVNTLQSIRGVTLDGVAGGSQYFTGTDSWGQVGGPGAPNFLTGTNAHTIEAWIFNPDLTPEETTITWARRGGPDGSNLSFNHGSDPTFGAVGHWGAGPDIGWGNAPTGGVAIGRWTHVAYTYQPTNGRVFVYKDGVVANTEVSNPRLNVHEFANNGTRLPFRIGSQNEANGTPTATLRGGMTIARIRVYETAFDGTTISNKFAAEADAFGVIDNDNDGLPTWYERLYPGCLDPNNPNDATLDCDTDGATNLEEYAADTVPITADTDGDGVSDGDELHRLVAGNPAPTNPRRPDTDQDGLTDGAEITAGTDPRLADTDGDRFADGQEVAHNSNPNDAVSTPDFEFEEPLAFINLDATTNALGGQSLWINQGALGGAFTASGLPTVTTVNGVRGTTFDGVNFYTGPVAPVFLTGSNAHTIVAWLYNPQVAPEENVFSWGRRGADGVNNSFNHGTDPVFGAVGHWGAAADIGWNGNISTGQWTFVAYTYNPATLTQSVYRDGQIANSETNILLNIAALDTSSATNQLPFRVATQNDATGTPTTTAGLRGTMTIGRIRVYDEALTPADILAQYNAELITFNPPQMTIRVTQVEICASTLAGFNYQVEYRSSATAGLWIPIACITGDGTRKCIVDTVSAGEPQRYYRVVVANCTP